MTEQESIAKAVALLPCQCDAHKDGFHTEGCHTMRRKAVAAALRKAYSEGESDNRRAELKHRAKRPTCTECGGPISNHQCGCGADHAPDSTLD